MVKYDTNGILQWRRELQDSERVFSLTERPNEGWAASGLTVDDQVGESFALFITNQDGVHIETRLLDILPDRSSKVPDSVIPTSDGHFMFIDSSHGRGIVFVKVDQQGNVISVTEIT